MNRDAVDRAHRASSKPNDFGRGTARHGRLSVPSIRLRPFVRKPLPIGTDAPPTLYGDPESVGGRKHHWGSLGGASVANISLNGFGETDATNPKLRERTISALRGFGDFESVWGIGKYGGDLKEYGRRTGPGYSEDRRIYCAMSGNQSFRLGVIVARNGIAGG